MIADISPILESLGLQKSEIKTYMAALKNGPSTVIALSKSVNLSRQATYLAIDSLTERGIMSSVQRGKKHFYAAEPPEKLVTYAKRFELKMKEKIADLERLAPMLELQMGGERPVVRVFEGKAGLKEVFEEVTNARLKETWEITDGKAMYSVLTREDLKSLHASYDRLKTRIHGLYAPENESKSIEQAGEESDHVILDPKYRDFLTDIGIYGNKLALMTFEGKMYSVVIESKPIVNTMKILFELAAKGARMK